MIIKPLDGWKENTLYLVDAAYSETNIVHRAVFFTGFLDNGNPSEYNTLFSPNYEENHSIDDISFMHVVRIIASEKDFKTDFLITKDWTEKNIPGESIGPV